MGAIPIPDLCALIDAWGKRDQEDGPALPDDEWVADSLLPDRLGVNMVFGTRRDTLAWRAELGITVEPQNG